jgi:hypothetical protein
MFQIGWRAVSPNRRSQANRRAVVRAEPVVAGLAQAAERAEPEGIVTAAMRLDMVRDSRRRDPARFEADAA